MVIITTSATEVSIQAVSPEFGVHFSSTAFFGSGSLAQADGAATASGAGAAAAGAAGAWAYELLTEAKFRKMAGAAPMAGAARPARVSFFNVMLGLLFER